MSQIKLEIFLPPEMYKFEFFLSLAFPRRSLSIISGNNKSTFMKRPVKQKKAFIPARNTWTAKFCLLGNSGQKYTPTGKEITILTSQGLGRKRVCFSDKDGDDRQFRNHLEEKYPMLKDLEGRYLLYRAATGGSGQRKLVLIEPGPDGYTIPWLKNDCALGGSFIYIVPTQENIHKKNYIVKQQVS